MSRYINIERNRSPTVSSVMFKGCDVERKVVTFILFLLFRLAVIASCISLAWIVFVRLFVLVKIGHVEGTMETWFWLGHPVVFFIVIADFQICPRIVGIV